MEQQAKKKSALALKILIPALIVCVLVVIYVEKQRAKPAADPSLSVPLVITEVDMEAMLAHGLPVMIDFGAEECGPCQTMWEDLVRVNAATQGRAVVQFVDVWKNPDAASNHPVRAVPTQCFYTADGSPYVPSMDLGIELLQYTHRETGEHLFTVHEGPLTEEEMLSILTDMGMAG